ncbi:hypothetical protein B0T17DRAFT_498864 [Bombardia bombarda]|uniref:Uncharacterized protein n=1 Tax=Bombardia bombarda TaxID=252184 RepID=A0AA39U7P5_9PEZI|nr:hypothetical protein B0T17DRAFT_498864 [Bombardia bombarda]
MQASNTLSSRWLGRVFGLDRCSAAASGPPPLYLCPALNRSPAAVAHFTTATSASTTTTAGPRQPCRQQHRSVNRYAQIRKLHAQSAVSKTEVATSFADRNAAKGLPAQCSGCGALSQTAVPDTPGYFDLSRTAVRKYLGLEVEEKKPIRVRRDDELVQQALRGVDLEELARRGIDLTTLLPEPRDPEATLAAAKAAKKPATTEPAKPLCDRCHKLVHHHSGSSIIHPGLDALRETIDASPYKYNHIYHVLDAADFPMSLLPKISQFMDVMPLRSYNRRAMTGKYYHGRQMEMSFIITRSDLLGYKKEQVDTLMPYFRATLRDALGRMGRNVRLGNIRCVSAKRNWWTTELKKEIWDRGGAGWMVGRVNVGKSRLFEAVFPKTKIEPIPLPKLPKLPIAAGLLSPPAAAPVVAEKPENQLVNPRYMRNGKNSSSDLLPPAQPETTYPTMPIVSSLPGTTAMPIRVPFGSGKGELIDLPGLSRGDLELFVKPEHRASLVMSHRIVPVQQTLYHSRSLLLGGFIRITPRDENVVFLAYAFTPIEAHVTQTQKAVLVQEQREGAPNVGNIAVEGTGERIKLAREVELKWDVTEERSGLLTDRKRGRGVAVEKLPYRVMAADVLIEGVGWVEIVCQVRTKDLGEKERAEVALGGNKGLFDGGEYLKTLDLSEPVGEGEGEEEDGFEDEEGDFEGEGEDEGEAAVTNYPTVDVYSPEGRFISSRRPMNAWEMNKPREQMRKRQEMSRPRRSMTGAKKREKVERRGEQRRIE